MGGVGEEREGTEVEECGEVRICEGSGGLRGRSPWLMQGEGF